MQLVSIPPLHGPRRAITNVEPGSADNDIEVGVFVSCLDPGFSESQDGSVIDACVLRTQSLEIPVSWGSAAAAQLPVGDQLGAEIWVVAQALAHAGLGFDESGFLGLRVLEEDAEEVIFAIVYFQLLTTTRNRIIHAASWLAACRKGGG